MVDTQQAEQPQTKQPQKQENMLLSIVFNVLLPTIIMSKLSSADRLGPVGALLLGVSIPLIYGIVDLIRRKKINWISVLGIVSVGITGGFGLMKVSGFWFAVKEATIPLIIGLATVFSLFMKRPFVEKMLLNEQVMDAKLIYSKLDENNQQKSFKSIVRNSTFMMCFAFLVSAAINYFMAVRMVVSTPGSEEYIAEIGKFTGSSYFVIMAATFTILFAVLFYFINGIKKLTGLDLEQMMNQPQK